MLKTWISDDTFENFRGDDNDQLKFISLETLKSSTGMEYYKVDVDDFRNAHEYWKLRKDRNYVYGDILEVSEKLMAIEDWTSKIKYGSEHRHEDEEIRLILGGGGNFDVRDKEDGWVRIHVSKGDLLILPPGIYHKFTFDTRKYIKVQRLFCKNHVWGAKDRPTADKK